jgi:molybdenum cofactor cytidylyltransferase
VNRASIAGVILAAGASSRMGQPKALLEYEGETFVHRLARILDEVCGRVVVVVGFDAERVRAASPGTATVIENPAPELGMLSSLQCGLGQVMDADAVIFLPVDYGAVRRETIAAVAAEPADAQIVVPEFDRRHGHPVRVSRAIVAELLALPHAAQAREVIRRRRDVTRYLRVDDLGVITDVDKPEDYRALVEARS